MNFAKLREKNFAKFSENFCEIFAKILNYFGKILQDLFLCVLFPVKLSIKKYADITI